MRFTFNQSTVERPGRLGIRAGDPLCGKSEMGGRLSDKVRCGEVVADKLAHRLDREGKVKRFGVLQ